MTTEGGTTQDVLGSARNPARVCSRAALGAHRGSEEIARCVSSSFLKGLAVSAFDVRRSTARQPRHGAGKGIVSRQRQSAAWQPGFDSLLLH